MTPRKPYIEVLKSENVCWQGWTDIIQEIQHQIHSSSRKKVVIAIECYHGTYEDLILKALKDGLSPNATCISKDLFKDEKEIREMVERNLASDKVFGTFFNHQIEDFFDQTKKEAIISNIDFIEEGTILIFGVGASQICDFDILIYADMSCWEIQQRFRRNDINNLGVINAFDTFENQYKWAVFVDWKVCNRLKKQLLKRVDYFLETNNWQKPKLAKGDAIREGLTQATKQPLFLAPFFDPGLWDSKNNQINENDNSDGEFLCYFNCIADENSILLKFGEYIFETPANNLVFFQPKELLGETVYRRFGAEMPIYFDFSDTLDQNSLSLQLYPDADFIHDNLGIYYVQEKSYYVMEAKSNAKVSLSLRKDINIQELELALKSIQYQNKNISVDKYLDEYKIKTHDHISIPSGVLHSSGEKAILLEINSAPSIYTFRLWCRNKGKRNQQVSISHVNQAIGLIQTNSLYPQSLINQVDTLKEVQQEKEERLGKPQSEFMDLRRHWFADKTEHHTHDTVQVLNLIEGDEVIVESPNNSFEPFIVHYAETFIIPAKVQSYTISPIGKSKGKNCAILKAFIRF